MISAIIAAGGKGTRMKAGKNKVFMEIGGRTILERTVSAFEENENIDEIIIVTAEKELCRKMCLKNDFKKVSKICGGGKERRDSVYNGIKAADGDIAVIHDGARCLISQEEIDAVIADCKKFGAAALGVKVKDSLKKADENGFISSTLDRDTIYQIQTPQVFERETIKNAHEKIKEGVFTDDCAIAERLGVKIKITLGSYENIKITTPEDIAIAEEILKKRK